MPGVPGLFKPDLVSQPAAYNQTAIKLQLSDSDKSSIDDVLNLKVIGMQGNAVTLKDLVTVTRQVKPKNIYRKKQKEVVYVLGHMATLIINTPTLSLYVL